MLYEKPKNQLQVFIDPTNRVFFDVKCSRSGGPCRVEWSLLSFVDMGTWFDKQTKGAFPCCWCSFETAF